MTNPKKYADVRTNPNILLSKQSLDIEIDTWNDKQPDIQKDRNKETERKKKMERFAVL